MKKNSNKAASAELLPQTELKGYAKFKKTLDDNGYLFCSFIIPFAIMWMIFISMRVFPFGPGSVLVLDLNGQYVYFFEALRNAVFSALFVEPLAGRRIHGHLRLLSRFSPFIYRMPLP